MSLTTRSLSRFATASCSAAFSAATAPSAGSIALLVMLAAANGVMAMSPMAPDGGASQYTQAGGEADSETSDVEIPNQTDGAEESDDESGPFDQPGDPDILGPSYRVNLIVGAGGWTEVVFLANSEQCLHLMGSGMTNLDLVVYDEEWGMLAIGKSPRDKEFICLDLGEPRILHAIIFNWGKVDHPCVLVGY
jgi:hypothetical protein